MVTKPIACQLWTKLSSCSVEFLQSDKGKELAEKAIKMVREKEGIEESNILSDLIMVASIADSSLMTNPIETYLPRRPKTTHVVQAYSMGMGWCDMKTAGSEAEAKELEQVLLKKDSAWMSGDYERQTRVVPVEQSNCKDKYNA